MNLPRLHLGELEDQRWFPSVLRRGLTDYLAEMTARTRPYRAVTPLLRDLVAESPNAEIVDLCSGAGGPWPSLLGEIGAGRRVTLTLTDGFPNLSALRRFPARSPVRYREKPLPADECSVDPGTIVTMFSSFHHFGRRTARQLLRRAAQDRASIAIFEATHRSLKAVVAMIVVPFAVLAVTPFIKPRRWWRFVFTYPIPIIPLAAWWDGVVSCLRTYRVEELRAMTRSADLEGMEWSVGELETRGAPLPVTYLIGRPRPVRTPPAPTAGSGG